MAKNHMKKCSSSLAIKEMQIKATVRFHLTPLTITISKTPLTTNVGEDAGEKGTLTHCWWECKLVQSLWKTILRFLKKTKHSSAI
jgi:hypothetical protein